MTHPVTIKFSELHNIKKISLLSVVKEPSSNFFDESDGNYFPNYLKNLCIPLLNFIKNEDIEANIVLTGNFLNKASQIDSEIIQTLKDLHKNKQIKLVADSYYGESLSSMYNFTWWSKGVEESIKTVNSILGVECDYIFLYEIYRSLPLEKIIHKFNINNFLLRQRGKKTRFFKTKLSEFRKYEGNQAFWINENLDDQIGLYFSPDRLFFDSNEVEFQPDADKAVKLLKMNIGSKYIGNSLMIDKKRQKTSKKPIRILENPSYTYFTNLQKAVIRIWEYISMLVISDYLNHKNEFTTKLYKQTGAIQNVTLLKYLESETYYKGSNFNFDSPYETFAVYQALMKQIEILLQNKL